MLFQRGWCWPTEGDALALLETSKFMVEGKLIPKPLDVGAGARRVRADVRRRARGLRQDRPQARCGGSSTRRMRRTCAARRSGIWRAQWRADGTLIALRLAHDKRETQHERRFHRTGHDGRADGAQPPAQGPSARRRPTCSRQPCATLTAAGATRSRDAARSRRRERHRHHDAARCAGRRARGARRRRHRRGHPARRGLHRHEHDRSATTRTVGAAIAAKGAAMIDSPVGKTADAAVAGTLTLMVGGDADGSSRVPAGARLHGHRLLPLRRARRRADDEAHQQPARHCGVGSVDRGARRRRQGGLALDTMMSVLRHDDGVEQRARDRVAQAAACRRLRPGFHDEARAQGLPARAADGRGARRGRAGRARPRWRASTKACGAGCRTTTSARC